MTNSFDPKPIIISNSNRVLFKRCRRKFDWQSTMRQNLVQISEAAVSPLWFGSGFHFALEDALGWNKFGSPIKAFDAYVAAFDANQLPADVDDLVPLGHGMLTHYFDYWLPRRSEYQTLWVNGEPQVEVSIDLDITELVIERMKARGIVSRYLTAPGMVPFEGRRIIVRVTLDVVQYDSENRLFVGDYKTARSFDVSKLETDPQVTLYTWAARHFYGDGFAVEGVMWMQFKKDLASPPKELKNGGFSQAQDQNTTYDLYVEALQRKFGVIPGSYMNYLNYLAEQEGPDSDKFIRRDIVRRNWAFTWNENEKLADEVLDMLDPHLALYPNPTRDCSWECNFRTACLMKDDGSDYEQYLADEFQAIQGYDQSWRNRIKWPAEGSE